MIRFGRRKALVFGFATVVTALLMAGTAFACDIFAEAAVTVTAFDNLGVSHGSVVATGNGTPRAYCSAPSGTATMVNTHTQADYVVVTVAAGTGSCSGGSLDKHTTYHAGWVNGTGDCMFQNTFSTTFRTNSSGFLPSPGYTSPSFDVSGFIPNTAEFCIFDTGGQDMELPLAWT